MQEYDYIIVGAGSSGCVLANRLTEDPDISVLIVEAGGSDSNFLFRWPAGFAKMTKGKMHPEGRLDLHGMTLDRAHGALSRFIISSHGSGRRLVLVITGKGKHRDSPGPIPVHQGVLRHQVPEWLRLAPLNSVVLQVTQAHISHGGGGAYYVYLRRSR